MNNAEKDLWRLLANLESLADEEAFAISQNNVAYLSELALTKSSLIDALILASELSQIGPDSNTTFNARFSSLVRKLSDNTEAMADSVKSFYQKILDNQFFWKKIKDFKMAYGSTFSEAKGEEPGKTFEA